MRYLLIAGLALLAAGCKDAEVAQLWSLGSRHKVTCYSGDRVIYDGEATGNVNNEHGSDGWYWMDAATGLLVEATGPCIIAQE